MFSSVSSESVSNDPTDVLIRDLLASQESPTIGEVRQIIQRIAAGLFPSSRKSISKAMQVAAHRYGHTLSNRGDSLTYHWAKHVVLQEQWDPRLSAIDYLRYVRNTIMHMRTEILLSTDYIDRTTVYFFASTDNIVPISDQGAGVAPQILVVYNAEDGLILTEHMLSSSSKTREKQGIWLRP